MTAGRHACFTQQCANISYIKAQSCVNDYIEYIPAKGLQLQPRMNRRSCPSATICACSIIEVKYCILLMFMGKAAPSQPCNPLKLQLQPS